MESNWEPFEFNFTAYEWDDEKAEANWKKHRIDFEDAAGIFKNIVVSQTQFEGREDRWQCIGIANGRELFDVFTEREGACRIISARVASRQERGRYYQVLGG